MSVGRYQKSEDIELREKSLQDILSRPPKWIVHSGTLLIVITLIFLLVGCVLIRVPEIIHCDAIAKNTGLESNVISVVIPTSNVSKIRDDDTLVVKFDCYPYEQYGFVRMTVKASSIYCVNGKYCIDIVCPDSLVTTSNRTIAVIENMRGIASIKVDEHRLIYGLVRPFLELFAK